MEKEYDIFISYSRKDYLMDDGKTPAPDKIVSKILKVLDAHSISYWIDKEGMYSSVQFAAVIEEQIASARCFLFVSTQASNASKYTLGEVFTAVEYEKPIIPFRADDSPFGKGIGFHLRPLDHIEYFKTGEEAFDKLVSSVNHIKAEQLYDQLIAEYQNIVTEYKVKLHAKSEEMKSLGITPPTGGMADEEELQKIKFKHEQEISRCQAEKTSLMAKVQDLQHQLETAKYDAQQLSAQSKATEGSLRDKMNEITRQLTEVNKSLSLKEKKIASLQQQLSSATASLNSVQKELQVYKDAEAKQKAAEEAKRKAEEEARRKAEEAKGMAEEEETRGIIKVGNVEFKMIHVEGGTFTMGEGSGAHQVTLSSYYIGETPVTQALWKEVTGETPSRFKGDQRPVESVSWNECQDFVKKLNAKTGKKFRLLTEAEWEFAARGGKKGKNYCTPISATATKAQAESFLDGFARLRYSLHPTLDNKVKDLYSGSNNLDEVAWYCDNSSHKTHPVKTKKSNELGIYDMSGNVFEWCQDWFGSFNKEIQTDPVGPDCGSRRVGRGGSWNYEAGYCQVSSRDGFHPAYVDSFIGLRLALSE